MKGMTVIVKKTTQLIAGIIFLYGIYIILHGHLTPGGGFAGGVILAGAFILRILAFGADAKGEDRSSLTASVFESIGGLLFIGVALAGMAITGIFFLNFLPKGVPLALYSAGIIPICNIAIGIKVSAGLFSIFLAIAAIKSGIEN